MPRALSLFLPTWSIDLLRRRSDASPGELRDSAILLIVSAAKGQMVARCCERALAAGVTQGMSLAHARALLPRDRLHIAPFQPQRDAAALRALAQWATRFSPLVAADPSPALLPDGSPEAFLHPPTDGLLIDITGCQRLFQGERRLINAVANAVEWLGFRARIATAPTFAAAWAMARFGERDRALVRDDQLREALAPLPLAALDIDQDSQAALLEVGVENIGQLMDLPRLMLPARFGADLLLRLDQALGQAIETLDPVRPPLRPRVERVFDGPVTQLEAVEHALRELVAETAAELLKRESGVRRMDVELARAGAEPARFSIAFTHPARDEKHLWSLLWPRAQSINMGFGIESMSLTCARLGRLPHQQLQKWNSGQANDEQPLNRAVGELLDTLANRLDSSRIVRFSPAQSHLGQRTFRATSALLPAKRELWIAPLTDDFRPSMLFDQPQRIEVIASVPEGPPSWLRWRGVEYTIITSFGPQRIADEWWRNIQADRGGAHAGPKNPADAPDAHAEVRDYFVIQTGRGQWLWVYRVLEGALVFQEWRGARWFVHGQWV